MLHGTFFDQFGISRRKKRDAPIVAKARLNCVRIAPHRCKDEITIRIIGRTCADKAEKAWFVADDLNGRRRKFFCQSAFAIWSRTSLEESENWYSRTKFVPIRAGHISSFTQRQRVGVERRVRRHPDQKLTAKGTICFHYLLDLGRAQ